MRLSRFLWRKSKNIFEQNVIVFTLYICILYFKKIGLKIEKIPICSSSPQSQIQIRDFTQNGEDCNSKKVTTDCPEIYTVYSTRLRLHLKKNIWDISQFFGHRPPFRSVFLQLHFFTLSHIQSTISELLTDRFSPFNVQSVLKYLIFNCY